MSSYVVAQQDDMSTVVQQHTKKNMSMVVDEYETFGEEAIRKAFDTFDLDKNGYIGVGELKHILIMSGELVSDEEVDMMISMLDLNGDGQVGYHEFKAMVECPDPANENFLEKKIYSPERTMQQRNNKAEQKRETFVRTVSTASMDKDDVFRILKAVRDKSPSRHLSQESYQLSYDDLCNIFLPNAFYSRSDLRQIFKLLQDEKDTIDCRDLIMTFTNFVSGISMEERCELAFDMYDVDKSGYLSIDEVEIMMASTNLMSRDDVKKRAENFMLCADTDRSGGITLNELRAAASKLPNLLYPPQMKK